MSSPPATANRRLILLVVAVVIVAGVVALLVSGPDEQSATAAVEVDGGALPAPSDSGGTDPALGQPAPVLSGADIDGEPMTVGEPDGAGQVVLFVAHWCPACQQEVPTVQQALDADELPEEVDLVAVSTSVDPARDNYPPDEWLADEGWQVPTLRDDGDSAALAAYTGGAGSFPFWAFLDADGRVVARHAGMLPPDDLASVMSRLAEL